MTVDQDRDRKRGLSAVHTVRAQRKSGRFGRTTLNMVLYAGLAIAAVMFVYNAWEKRAIESARRALMGEVRAARATVGAEWEPLQASIERYAGDEAFRNPTYPGDVTDPGMADWQFRDQPGLYVRLRLRDVVGTPDFATEFRKLALSSTHDGFTSCLLRTAATGVAKDGVLSDQPWNLKTAYQAVRVLGDDWMQEVESADSQLRLRAFSEQWQAARDTDIPRAIEMMTRSRFFLMVYDEDVPALDALAPGDGGTAGMAELQSIPHPVRILLVDLQNKRTARRRIQVDSTYRLMGESPPLEGSDASLRRQVQNCQLARAFAESMHSTEK